jgi:exopolysaccharide production protein ExoZ
MKNPVFHSLQIYRGIAALIVVFHHLWNNLQYYFHLNYPLINFLASHGRIGVDFFFVLSGFIICYSNYDFSEKAFRIIPYLRNRILRIYIPYLPLGIFMLLAYQLSPGLSESNREVSVLKSLFLIPIPGNTALSVAWTLVYEMFFYVVFVSWFLSRRLFASIIVVWLMFILYANLVIDFDTLTGFFGFIGSYYNIEFMLGMALAIVYRRKWIRKRIAALLMVIGIAMMAFFVQDKFFVHLLIGLFFTLLVGISLNSPLDRISESNLWMIIGNASYSIYLIHNLLISVFLRLPGLKFNFVITGIVVFFICVLFGVIYSKIFEEYFMKTVKRYFH